MKLQEWCTEAEKIDIALGKQYFNMEVGLKYDKKKIGTLEKQNLAHSKLFLKNFKKPKELYLANVGSVAGSETYKLALKLKEERQKKIKTKVNKKTVNWNTWRQFVITAKDKERKQVFDKFITQVPKITPLIEKRFNKCAHIYAKHNTDPLSMFCYDSRITLKNLKNVLEQLKSLFVKKFQRQWKHYSNQLLQRDPAYYDDMYFMRNVIYRDLVEDFKHIDPLKEVYKLFKTMGLDSSRITLDKVNRKKKYPSPFCSFIQIPTDIRVSYKKENPLNDTVSIFHEYGHAIHASNIDPKTAYWKKYTMSNSFAETFSTFFEHLISNKLFLTNRLKVPEDLAQEIVERVNFIQLFSIAFYCANSLFRIKYWEKGLTFPQSDKEYAKQLKETLGMKIPGQYWQLHHILPESLMYVPAYMLAMIKAQEIEGEMITRYGYEWWDNKKSHEYMLKIIKPGTDSEINDYNNLKPKILKQRFS